MRKDLIIGVGVGIPVVIIMIVIGGGGHTSLDFEMEDKTIDEKPKPDEPILSSPTASQPSKNRITWTNSTLLQWSDFQGEPPIEQTFEDGVPIHAATTTYGKHIGGSIGIISTDPCIYKISPLTYVAEFDKTESWVVEEYRKDLKLLNHEQRHFDIRVIFVKVMQEKVNLELVNKPINCTNSVYDESSINLDANIQIENMVSDLKKELDKYNDDYDAETEHGRIPSIQQNWDNKIDNQLTELGIGRLS